jgi:hypothetical protein
LCGQSEAISQISRVTQRFNKEAVVDRIDNANAAIERLRKVKQKFLPLIAKESSERPDRMFSLEG